MELIVPSIVAGFSLVVLVLLVLPLLDIANALVRIANAYEDQVYGDDEEFEKKAKG